MRRASGKHHIRGHAEKSTRIGRGVEGEGRKGGGEGEREERGRGGERESGEKEREREGVGERESEERERERERERGRGRERKREVAQGKCTMIKVTPNAPGKLDSRCSTQVTPARQCTLHAHLSHRNPQESPSLLKHRRHALASTRGPALTCQSLPRSGVQIRPCPTIVAADC